MKGACPIRAIQWRGPASPNSIARERRLYFRITLSMRYLGKSIIHTNSNTIQPRVFLLSSILFSFVCHFLGKHLAVVILSFSEPHACGEE
ncbi:hypothetical protein LZ32DRAFT_127078 [Colletotrichum eremochloae]|nr:hypothetical protein LZ32DRAFT_127078 [Colletotrichum eremochloae]